MRVDKNSEKFRKQLDNWNRIQAQSVKRYQQKRKQQTVNKKKVICDTDIPNRPSNLQLWYENKMQTSEKICMNCLSSLAHYNETEWHGSQAHIFPKTKYGGFPSIATDENNHMVLGFYCCHTQWDSSWLNASKMKVFPYAKAQFQKFKDRIAMDEVRRIPEIFLAE